ncbi:MAG: hypothetical protein J6O62_01205 [Bacilli bacterium]|nr:hypothetical protein [Bacilli bacterium]
MFPNQFYSPMQSLAPIARKTINWGNLLSNTQKTLNIVNQAIPIVYQIKPIVNNARTIFKVANEFTKTNEQNNITVKKQDDINYDDGPSFFI